MRGPRNLLSYNPPLWRLSSYHTSYPPHTWQTFLLSYLEQSLHPHLPLAWKPSQLLSEADVENGTFAVWSIKTSSAHLLWCNASCSWVSYVSVAVNCCSSAVSGCQCQCIARLSFPLEANGRIRLSSLVTLSVDASALLYLYFSFLQYRRLSTVVFVLNFFTIQAAQHCCICTCGFLQFHIGSGSAYYGYPELGYHLKCYNILVWISIPPL